jgi:chromate transporter
MASSRPHGSALGVFAVALRLGLTSFGGPVAHIGYYRREYVERRRWLDGSAFADLVALAQFLPGPASTELSIAIGIGRAGVLGGLAAWLGFTLPSALAMLALGVFAAGTDLSGAGWVHGLKLAAVAIVAQAVIVMAQAHAPDGRRRIMAVAAGAAALAIASPIVQVAVIVAGAVLGRVLLTATTLPQRVDEPPRVSRRVGVLALATFAVLLVALPVARQVGGQAVALFDSFYRTGALVFGGGHVVLPLLHANVVDPGWVTDGAFVAGYGAAQAVPGPLFTFAAYLGAVSAVQPNGIAGGVLALIAIFLPAFLLVVGVLPFWDRLRSVDGFRRALLGTNAAVVGILAAALYTPVWTSAVGGWVDAAMAAVGLAVLLRTRVPMIAIVAAAAILGQVVLGG